MVRPAGLLERLLARVEVIIPDRPWLRAPILESARLLARPARRILGPMRRLFPRRRR